MAVRYGTDDPGHYFRSRHSLEVDERPKDATAVTVKHREDIFSVVSVGDGLATNSLALEEAVPDVLET